ncbi:MAG: hypothetical protein U0795_26735 [Pirellulales bacterium]
MEHWRVDPPELPAGRGMRSQRPAGGASLEGAELDALRRLHDQFARRWSQRLTGEIHEPVRVDLQSLQTGTYAELALGVPVPTCLALLQAVPLGTRVVLEFGPSILYPLFDWMLGGGPEPSPPPARPMTEIETVLAERLIGSWCEEYAEVWRHVLSLELRVERFEHNPLRVRPLPPSAPLMLAIWDVEVPGATGSVTCGIPWSAMLPMSHKLTSGPGHAVGGPSSGMAPEIPDWHVGHVRESEAELPAVLRQRDILP